MSTAMAIVLGALFASGAGMTSPRPALAQNATPWRSAPFTSTLSNNTPVAFGMNPATAAQVLDTSLTYVSGRPGSEVLVAIRTGGGSGFFDRRDRLYLQFRRGQLTGWKGDWGSHWMWR
jgi:hypothetical protein